MGGSLAKSDTHEPPEHCEHEEWSTDERTYVTSQTQDIDIRCDQCKETGTLSFVDGETIDIGWDG